MSETLINATLQESLVTTLAWDDVHGRVVANLVKPELFEGDFRTIAERCVTYWRQHGSAPKVHTTDLVADILDDPHNRKAATFRRLLSAMYELSGSVNTQYVLQQLRNFTRMQRLKEAIVKSAEQLNAQQETAIAEVEAIWNELLRVREMDFEPGMRLTDIDRLLHYMETQFAEFQTGIEQLDKANIVPYRDALFLILGATGRGKSWLAIHIGKNAIRQRKKVLHVSLEMSEEQVAQRYLQGLFSISKRDPRAKITTLELTESGRLAGFGTDMVQADFTFNSDLIRDELTHHLAWGGKRWDNLIIKRFPPNMLTADTLRGYLDNLEVVEKFIPDMMIVDYIGLMKIDMRNPRQSLGQSGMALRGLGVERHMAVIAPQQVSKEGAKSRKVKHTHVAEDWSLTNTADIIVTLSQTDSEERLGLARLYAAKARDEAGAFGVLITQNLNMGQFALESARLTERYFDFLDAETDANDDEKDDQSDESDE